MHKKAAFLLTSALLSSTAVANIAQIPQGEGKIFNTENVTLVRKTFSPEHPMERHNHPGAKIMVTIISGEANITINDDEHYQLSDGAVLIFDGSNDISATFTTETLITVTLIESTAK